MQQLLCEARPFCLVTITALAAFGIRFSLTCWLSGPRALESCMVWSVIVTLLVCAADLKHGCVCPVYAWSELRCLQGEFAFFPKRLDLIMSKICGSIACASAMTCTNVVIHSLCPFLPPDKWLI